ncbi:MAG: hypothetical protein GF347_01710 [Candidatus Moranbacteria bacterium]|nr:hypothetical protein [Candidatus Moranbacteria bacterium]
MGKIEIDNSKNELKEKIEIARLTEQQKKMWKEVIQKMSSQDVLLIIEILKNNPQALVFLTENLEEKMDAIKSKDKMKWEKIIEKEKSFIETQ